MSSPENSPASIKSIKTVNFLSSQNSNATNTSLPASTISKSHATTQNSAITSISTHSTSQTITPTVSHSRSHPISSILNLTVYSNSKPNKLCRLIDYFCVVEYNQNSLNEKDKTLITFRCPNEDYDPSLKSSTKFQQISSVVQIEPWKIKSKYQSPTFFVLTLNDELANRYYASCLQFYEKINDFEYVPKCLVLQSTQEYFEAFRNILNIIYCRSVYFGLSKEKDLNNLTSQLQPTSNPNFTDETTRIQHIYECITNATNFHIKSTKITQFLTVTGDQKIDSIPIEASKLKFKSYLPKKLKNAKSPLNTIKPLTAILSTGKSCYNLLKKIGAKDLLTLVYSALMSKKIVLYSNSVSIISEGLRAILALIYPFDYCGFYPSILSSTLPIEDLLEGFNCLMGLTKSTADKFMTKMIDLEYIIVDLDGGRLQGNLSYISSAIEESKILNKLKNKLTNILFPRLAKADFSFIDQDFFKKLEHKTLEVLDKEVRSVFLVSILELFKNYRTFIRVIRTHPEVICRFDVDGFLNEGLKDHSERNLVKLILESQEWAQFIEQRGTPYRWIDMFDKAIVKQNLPDEYYPKIITEFSNESTYGNFSKIEQDVFNAFHNFEYPDGIEKQHILPAEINEITHLVNYSMVSDVDEKIQAFPTLNSETCQKLVKYQNSEEDLESVIPTLRIVPTHPNIDPAPPIRITRHLETLKTFINNVFMDREDKAAEAKRLYPAVKRQLTSLKARTTLVGLFLNKIPKNKNGTTRPVEIGFTQFDTLADALNLILKKDSTRSYNEIEQIAINILPCITMVYRNLKGEIYTFAGKKEERNKRQSLYTMLQDNPIWLRESFWTNMFEQNVQDMICKIHHIGLKERLIVIDEDHLNTSDNTSIDSDIILDSSQNSLSTVTTKSPPLVSTGELKYDNSDLNFNNYSKYESKYAMKVISETIEKSIKHEIVSKNGNSPADEEKQLILSEITGVSDYMVQLLWPFKKQRFGAILTDGFKLTKRMHESKFDERGNTNSSTWYHNDLLSSDIKSNAQFTDRKDRRREQVNEVICKIITLYIDSLCSLCDIQGKFSKQLVQTIIPDLCSAQNKELAEIDELLKECSSKFKTNEFAFQHQLLSGEETIANEFNFIRLENTFENSCLNNNFSMEILPCQGKLIITNYRIIYQGNPIEPIITDRNICISIPIGTIYKIYTDRGKFQFNPNEQMGQTNFLRVRSLNNLPLILSLHDESTRDGIANLLNSLVEDPVSYDNFAKSHQISKLDHKKFRISRRFKNKANSAENSPITPVHLGKKTNTLSTPQSFQKMMQGKPKDKMNTMNKMKGTMNRMFTKSNKNKENKRLLKKLNENSNVSGNRFNPLKTLQTNMKLDSHPEKPTVLDNYLPDSHLAEKDHQNMVDRSILVSNQHPNLEIDHFNNGFKRIPTYPWSVESIKNILNKLPPKMFEEYRYPVFHFTNAAINSGFFFKSSKFTVKIINLIESTVARLTGSSRSGVMLPNASEIWTHADKKYLPTLEEFYLNLCDITSKKCLIVLEKSSSVSKERSWNFSPVFGDKNDRDIKVKGIKTYSVSKFDKIIKNFERSLRSFPGEKIEVKNRRITPDALPVHQHHRIGTMAQYHTLKNHTLEALKKLNFENLQNYSDFSLYHEIDTEYFDYLNYCLLTAKDLSERLKEFNIHLALDITPDYSAVLSSLINIFISPISRTIDGFLNLIKKEFILSGHKFKSRVNMQMKDLAPFYLSFIDAVHQLLLINPHQFEFNLKFLETLAYHAYSRRFKDFLYDSEYERYTNKVTEFKNDNNFVKFIENNKANFINQLYVANLGISATNRNLDGQPNSSQKVMQEHLDLFYTDANINSTTSPKLKIFKFWISTKLLNYNQFELTETNNDLVQEEIVEEIIDNINQNKLANESNNVPAQLKSYETNQLEIDSQFNERKIYYAQEKNYEHDSYYNDLLMARNYLQNKLNNLKKMSESQMTIQNRDTGKSKLMAQNSSATVVENEDTSSEDFIRNSSVDSRNLHQIIEDSDEDSTILTSRSGLGQGG